MQTQQLRKLLESEDISVELLATNAAYAPRWIGEVPVARALARLIPYLWKSWRLAGRCDVIHLMANSGWSWHLFSAPVLLLAPLRGTPVVVNYRGGEAHSFFERAMRWVRPMLGRATSIVVPSGYLRDVFSNFGFAVQVIPNIIDRSWFSPRTQDSETGAEAPFLFVITRNLEPIYGIDTAIRALALLRSKGIEADLEIAGSGPQEQSLRGLTRDLDLADNVRFLGRLDRPEIADLYRRADVMLNPTTVDNMPNSVIEALACGVPVISSNIGGVPFIVKDRETALLVPVGNGELFADAMREIMTDPDLRRRLAENGEASVSDYEWQTVGPMWLSAYRGAVAA